MSAPAFTEVSCGAVTFRFVGEEAQVLLIKQFPQKAHYAIPKGHLKPGETYEECACREVLEETGVAIRLTKRLPDTVVPLRNGSKLVISFIAEPIGASEPSIEHPDCEVVEARWFPAASLPTIQRSQSELVKAAIVAVLG